MITNIVVFFFKLIWINPPCGSIEDKQIFIKECSVLTYVHRQHTFTALFSLRTRTDVRYTVHRPVKK